MNKFILIIFGFCFACVSGPQYSQSQYYQRRVDLYNDKHTYPLPIYELESDNSYYPPSTYQPFAKEHYLDKRYPTYNPSADNPYYAPKGSESYKDLRRREYEDYYKTRYNNPDPNADNPPYRPPPPENDRLFDEPLFDEPLFSR